MKLRLSLRNHLLIFGLICLVPALVATALLAVERAATERQRMEERAVAFTTDFERDIEAEVAGRVNVLQALSVSPAIDAKDFKSFERQAVEVAKALDAVIVLRAPDGLHMASSITPVIVGEHNPKTIDPVLIQADKRAIETRQPQLSDLYQGVTDGRNFVSIVYPVLRDDQVVFLLTLAMSPQFVGKKLTLGASAEAGWLAAVVGSDMRLVARTRDPQIFVGRPATGDLREAMLQADSGTVKTRTLDEVDVFTAFRHTSMGWAVVVSVPETILNQPVRHLILILAGLAIFVVLVTLLGAFVYGRRLGREVSTLSRNARAMGTNAPLLPYTQHIEEVAAAQQALFDAQKQLSLLIAELNHRVKNTLTVIKVIAGRSVGNRRDRDAVSGRISALTLAHEALSETQWRGADLRKLVNAVARSVDAAIGCEGPAITLLPKAAVSMAQVVQELISNARQHGALRERSGRVDLVWRIDGENLHLDWIERSPLKPQPPTHAAGFGLQVVDLCIARQLGGRIHIETEPEGWRIALEFPMDGELGTAAVPTPVADRSISPSR